MNPLYKLLGQQSIQRLLPYAINGVRLFTALKGQNIKSLSIDQLISINDQVGKPFSEGLVRTLHSVIQENSLESMKDIMNAVANDPEFHAAIAPAAQYTKCPKCQELQLIETMKNLTKHGTGDCSYCGHHFQVQLGSKDEAAKLLQPIQIEGTIHESRDQNRDG